MNDIIKVNYDSGKPLVSGRELQVSWWQKWGLI